jgi:hypothetical protein
MGIEREALYFFLTFSGAHHLQPCLSSCPSAWQDSLTQTQTWLSPSYLLTSKCECSLRAVGGASIFLVPPPSEGKSGNWLNGLALLESYSSFNPWRRRLFIATALA